MEEKISELIKTAIELEKTSKKHYVEVHFGWRNRLGVCIRNKETFNYVKTTEIDLEEDIFTIEDVIVKIKELERKERK